MRFILKCDYLELSLVVRGLKVCTSSAGDASLILGWGTT